MTLHIRIITPENIVLDQDVDEVVLPTTSGEIAVLPNHVPVVTQIAPGVMLVKSHGKEDPIAIDGGFVQITDKDITILADFATHARDISVAKAEEAKRAAEKALQEKKSDVDFAAAEAEFRRAILELKAAQRTNRH